MAQTCDQALDGVVDGPASTVTNKLSYAECILAIRRGELHDGVPLQQKLVGYTARAYVISLGGAEAGAHDCARMMGAMGMLVNEHITSLRLPGDRMAALVARLLATTATPFSFTPAEITVRLTHPEVLDVLDKMLIRTATSPPSLSEDEMLSAVDAIAPDEARSEHPWLMAPVHLNSMFRDYMVPYSQLNALLQTSISTFELGPPLVHICIVEAGAQYFVCAWQLTLQRMRALEMMRPAHGSAAVPANAQTTPAAQRSGPPAALACVDGAATASAAMARAQAAVAASLGSRGAGPH